MVEMGREKLAAQLRKNLGEILSGPAELLGLIDFMAIMASAGVTGSNEEGNLISYGTTGGRILLSVTKAFLNWAEKVSVFSASRTAGPVAVSRVGTKMSEDTCFFM